MYLLNKFVTIAIMKQYIIKYFSKRVQDEILDLSPRIRADYARLSGLLEENGPELGMPFSRTMGDGLFELRLSGGSSGIARAFYCFKKGKNIYILHVFEKKTQKTPKKEMDIARKRMKELE